MNSNLPKGLEREAYLKLYTEDIDILFKTCINQNELTHEEFKELLVSLYNKRKDFDIDEEFDLDDEVDSDSDDRTRVLTDEYMDYMGEIDNNCEFVSEFIRRLEHVIYEQGLVIPFYPKYLVIYNYFNNK